MWWFVQCAFPNRNIYDNQTVNRLNVLEQRMPIMTGSHVFFILSSPSAPWVETVVIYWESCAGFFFITQLPRLELTARVHSLRIHVPRLIPKHTAPLHRAHSARAQLARGSLFADSLVSGSERFSSLFLRSGYCNRFQRFVSNYDGPY